MIHLIPTRRLNLDPTLNISILDVNVLAVGADVFQVGLYPRKPNPELNDIQVASSHYSFKRAEKDDTS